MDQCYACERMAQRDTGNVALWDRIYRTQFWAVVHNDSTALCGWLVVIAARHMVAIDEMTEDEAIDLGKLIRHVSVALKESTACAKTYIMQFAEAPGHQHVHFHVVPRATDLPEDHRGLNVFKYQGVPIESRISETVRNELAAKLQRILLTM